LYLIENLSIQKNHTEQHEVSGMRDGLRHVSK